MVGKPETERAGQGRNSGVGGEGMEIRKADIKLNLFSKEKKTAKKQSFSFEEIAFIIACGKIKDHIKC